MNIGTRSVLFGAHQFIIHPIFVFAAWWKLYGFPWDPRLWVEVERLAPKPRRQRTPEEIQQRIDDNFFDEEYD